MFLVPLFISLFVLSLHTPYLIVSLSLDLVRLNVFVELGDFTGFPRKLDFGIVI